MTITVTTSVCDLCWRLATTGKRTNLTDYRAIHEAHATKEQTE
jgi:hypothetical protein